MIEHFNRTTRLIIAIALAVLIWVVGVIIGQEQTITILNPEGSLINIITRARTVKVSLMIDDGTGSVKIFQWVSLPYGSSVLDLLNEVKKEKKIDLSYKQNEKNQEFSAFRLNNLSSVNNGKEWLVWQDQQLITEPFNRILLKANDFIELKYLKLKTE